MICPFGTLLKAWEGALGSALEPYRQVLADLKSTKSADLATRSAAMHELRGLG